ncbi:MAG: hypothetical protein M0Q21_07150 [Ignavibacteriaceae bacterium]|nr:hypothetical protein [Ignavibacteriaceae bacterium]
MVRVLSFILVFCSSLLSLAQENSNYRTNALSFSFNGLNLGSYNGGVGGRRWISKSTVINASIGGSIYERKYEKTATLDKGLEKTKSLYLGLGVENHLESSNDFSPFLSYRLEYGFNDRYYRGVYSTNENRDRTNSLNIDFGLGIEYWILNRISLSGQHLFNARYETGERSTGGTPNEIQKIKGFQTGLGTTSIILSIYF